MVVGEGILKVSKLHFVMYAINRSVPSLMPVITSVIAPKHYWLIGNTFYSRTFTATGG